MCSNRILLKIAAFAVVVWLGVNVQAAGVPVGSSSLFDTLDYSDTFTIDLPDRPGTHYYNPYFAPDHYYEVETAYNGLSPSGREWGQHQHWTFVHSGAAVGLDPDYPGDTGNAGAATGFLQGWEDVSFPYGARDDFIVQFDAIPAIGRIDIVSLSAPHQHASLVPPIDYDGLTVFIRPTGGGGAEGEITLYNAGIGGIDTGLTSGIPAGNTQWHNFAVRFDTPNRNVSVWVDEVLRGTVNLDDPVLFGTFFAGITMPNAAVGGGGFNIDETIANPNWIDNFQVGAPLIPGAAVPEPAVPALLLGAILTFGLFRRRTANG